MKKGLFIIIFFLLVGFISILYGEFRVMNTSHTGMRKMVCNYCHSCYKPNGNKPCLKEESGLFLKNKSNQSFGKYKGKDQIKLNDFRGDYGAVKFPHKKIAHYASKINGCIACHHHTEDLKGTRYKACKNCHKENVNDTTVVNLKTAYHRGCIDCHLQLDIKENCTYCHKSMKKDKINYLSQKNSQTNTATTETTNNTNSNDQSIYSSDNYTPSFGEMCYPHINTYTERIMSPMHSASKELLCNGCHKELLPNTKNPKLNYNAYYFKDKNIIKNKKVKYEGREVLYLDNIRGDYRAVKFPHKKIVHNIATQEGCTNCHHHSPPGQYTACKKCHDVNTDSIVPINLKAAYHRACINCHMTWSQDTQCAGCHSEKGKSDFVKVKKVRKKYCTTELPFKKRYKTSYGKGKYVHFFHKNHTTVYGVSCNNCHQDQSCVGCHYNKDNITAFSPKRINKASDRNCDKCASCHDVENNDNCSYCHSENKKKDIFDHNSIGKTFTTLHQSLKCKKCHVQSVKTAKLNKDCNSCHTNWTKEGFSHGKVGLVLDKNHNDQYCEFCHYEGFDQKPSCIACHDKDVQYPGNKPGEKIEMKMKM
ncbi:cytochrome c3 family protein [Spirochaetota bacterium]